MVVSNPDFPGVVLGEGCSTATEMLAVKLTRRLWPGCMRIAWSFHQYMKRNREQLLYLFALLQTCVLSDNLWSEEDLRT